MMPHEQTPNWGICPILFTIGGFPVHSYSFFVIMGLIVGLLLFWRETQIQKASDECTFYVLLAALFGGALGSKLAVCVLHWKEILAHFPDLSFLVSGRSIVGALIGGALGVFLVKKKMNITTRFGNLYVPAIAAGILVGRIGCLLRGCCYGTPTNLPWGINFGDGIARHTTQIYEMLFMILLLCIGYIAVRKTPNPPGFVFKGFMIVYFSFRFLEEFIRQGNVFWLGLTIFQWIACAVVLFYTTDVVRLLRKEKRSTL